MERGADTYDWDAGDKLTSATVASLTTTMVYNGDGLRDSRTVGEDTVTFTWDVARSIAQVIDDGSLAYVYSLGRIAQVAADDTTYCYLSDGLGSTMALTGADGDVVNTYDYDVFGTVRYSSGSQPNEFRFTGEQNDPTGLEYLRARYYDPAIGRFLTQDPLLGSAMAPLSLNRYPYVLNNPLRWLDPWGLRNVEGTPTPTPGNQYRVCRAIHGQNVDCQYLLPSGGNGIWGDVGNIVGDVWGAYKAYYRHAPDYLVYQHVVRPASEFAYQHVVVPAWEILTSRSQSCYAYGTVAFISGLATALVPESAPVSYLLFTGVVEAASTSCVVD